MGSTESDSKTPGIKEYFLARWKRRWLILPAMAILVPVWLTMIDRTRARRTVIGAVIFVIIVILFPFHFGGEDWNEPTRS